MALMRLDFPQPDCPTTRRDCPFSSSKLRSCRQASPTFRLIIAIRAVAIQVPSTPGPCQTTFPTFKPTFAKEAVSIRAAEHWRPCRQGPQQVFYILTGRCT